MNIFKDDREWLHVLIYIQITSTFDADTLRYKRWNTQFRAQILLKRHANALCSSERIVIIDEADWRYGRNTSGHGEYYKHPRLESNEIMRE